MFGRNGYGKHVTDEMNGLDEMAGAIVGLGALNWGLVGLANFDAVRAMFGKGAAARAAYGLIGASAAYAVVRGTQLAKR